ncbi:unnamed protein product [Amoebophrya sp. A25]|nr:unnamed protein product [Amoebophrya sp. A25]|eukprot:GSA25T00024487001.1
MVHFTIREVVSFFCAILPVFLFLAPFTVLLPVICGRRSLDMPPLAFIAQMLQCGLWFVHGTGLRNSQCTYVNFGGLVTGFLYSILYRVYSGERGQHQLQEVGDAKNKDGELRHIVLVAPSGTEEQEPETEQVEQEEAACDEESEKLLNHSPNVLFDDGEENSLEARGRAYDSLSTLYHVGKGSEATTQANFQVRDRNTNSRDPTSTTRYTIQWSFQFSASVVVLLVCAMLFILLGGSFEFFAAMTKQLFTEGSITSATGAYPDYHDHPQLLPLYWFLCILGWLAFASNVAMFSHPIAVLPEVLRTGKTDLMGSTSMNLTGFLNSFFWAVSALFYIGRSGPVWSLAVSNLLGALFSMIALGLRLKLFFCGERETST